MGKLFFPKGLLYKEWVQKRWIALCGFLFICPSVVLLGLTPDHRFRTMMGPTGSVQQVDVMVTNLNSFCNAVVSTTTTGLWASLIVVGLALFSLWTERNQEVLWFSLSGPVTKRQLMRAKYSFDLALIVAIFTALTIGLIIIDVAFGLAYPLNGIIRWWGVELAIQCSMYALALLLAVLIGNAIVCALLTFGIANIPMYLGVPMTYALGANLVVFLQPSKYAIPLSWKLMWLITHLSPLNWFSLDFTHLWTRSWPYFLWFSMFTVLICLVSERIYEGAANERLGHLFTFKWLKHPLTAMLSGFIAYIVVSLTSDGSDLIVEITWILVITIALWVGLTLVGKRSAARS